jgi:hypothetical protein
MQVFLLLEYAVILIGGLVAGVISLLLPKISSGISFSLLLSLMVLLGSQVFSSASPPAATATVTTDPAHLSSSFQTLVIIALIALGAFLAQTMEVRPLTFSEPFLTSQSETCQRSEGLSRGGSHARHGN